MAHARSKERMKKTDTNDRLMFSSMAAYLANQELTESQGKCIISHSGARNKEEERTLSLYQGGCESIGNRLSLHFCMILLHAVALLLLIILVCQCLYFCLLNMRVLSTIISEANCCFLLLDGKLSTAFGWSQTTHSTLLVQHMEEITKVVQSTTEATNSKKINFNSNTRECTCVFSRSLKV